MYLRLGRLSAAPAAAAGTQNPLGHRVTGMPRWKRSHFASASRPDRGVAAFCISDPTARLEPLAQKSDERR
jgi:hypothetical protein